MGSIADYLENELLDHIFNAAYSPVATVYLALSKAFSIRNSSYQWTLSSGGSNEYYLEASGGGNPNLGGDPGIVIENEADMTPGTLGSLTAGQWAYGDNDSLGYSSIYVRLSDSTDPDTKAVDYLLAGGNPFDDASGLDEPSGGSYARQSIAFNAAASRKVDQSADISFPVATADWGFITHWAIMDAASAGNMLAHGRWSNSKKVVSGNQLTANAGQVYVQFNAGKISNALAHNLLDLAFRNQAYGKPNTFVALCTANISDTDTGSTITEPAGGSYARKQVNPNGGASPTWDLAAAGALDNTHKIEFTDPTADWGTITALAIVSAASGGDLLVYDNDITEQAPGSGDKVSIPIGECDVTLS